MKKIIEKIKKNEALYRALRTFIQAFIGTVAASIATTGIDNFDKKAIISLLSAALASAVAAVMNVSKNNEPKNPEDISEVD